MSGPSLIAAIDGLLDEYRGRSIASIGDCDVSIRFRCADREAASALVQRLQSEGWRARRRAHRVVARRHIDTTTCRALLRHAYATALPVARHEVG